MPVLCWLLHIFALREQQSDRAEGKARQEIMEPIQVHAFKALEVFRTLAF